MILVKYCRLIQRAITIPGLGIEFMIQDGDGVTLLLELISVFIGLHIMPIVYSSLIPRHNNCHHSWGGGDLGEGGQKWQGGALATDGVIYCIPFYPSRVLAIDPFKECSATLQINMTLYPDELGCLFLKDEECDETFFETLLRKFGESVSTY